MASDRAIAMACGCDGYLEKPIGPATFMTDIERFLRPKVKDAAP